MILPGSASLILSAVQQLIKLGGRIDSLMAQRSATQSDLVLQMPAMQLGNTLAQVALVSKALAATAGQSPDPFGTDRVVLMQQVAQPGPAFDPLFAKYFPDAASGLVISPDAAYLAQLQQAFPGLDWTNPAVRIAACAIAAGPSSQQVSYSARVALAVADTLLEFGADNTALFIHDPKLSGVVQSVLERFAQPDWSSFTQWSPLLQTALRSTLNAALDVSRQLPTENPWLDSVFDALAQARAAAPDPDNYLLGLLQGEGVPLLLSKGLLVASNELGTAQAGAFKLVASDVLAAAAPFVLDPGNPGLGAFFQNHWGDLLRAGLASVARHGDVLLAPGQPLLSGVLTAMVQQLATTPSAGFLSSETLYHLADTAVGVVVANPGELPGLAHKPWLHDFLVSAATTAQQLSVKGVLTPQGAESLVLDAVGVLAKYPQLVVSGQGLPLTLTTSVLTAVSQLGVGQLGARTIGEAALKSALEAIAADPSLVSNQFGPVVTALAQQLATGVGQKQFTADQAAGVVSAAVEAIARNPQLYAGAQAGLATAVVSALQRTFPAGSTWAARLLVDTANQTLLAVGRNGAAAAKNQTVTQVEQLLTTVLSAGLTTAGNELGTSTDLDGIPPILGGLVAQALRGNLTVFDPASPAFTAAFQALAAAA